MYIHFLIVNSISFWKQRHQLILNNWLYIDGPQSLTCPLTMDLSRTRAHTLLYILFSSSLTEKIPIIIIIVHGESVLHTFSTLIIMIINININIIYVRVGGWNCQYLPPALHNWSPPTSLSHQVFVLFYIQKYIGTSSLYTRWMHHKINPPGWNFQSCSSTVAMSFVLFSFVLLQNIS